ncbi:MAG: SusC/RagA family TonB-linked outer membrane protein [Cyclobacteriaceae bacterium]
MKKELQKRIKYLPKRLQYCNFLFCMVVVFCLSLHNAQAQGISIEGSILDDATGEGIPGANVVLKADRSVGTITDFDGKFQLVVPATTSTLVISYIGFETKEVKVGSETSLNISLSTTTEQLSEVVVTALGVKKKERALGYSVQKVEAEGLDEAIETNFVNSLQGKISGAQISGSPGTMGGSSRILLRGINSVSGNNQPLFIVDGIPLDNGNFNDPLAESGEGGRPDYGNAIQDINPNEIESISVLKGPSAAALYGSRAANGAILITTKSGQSRQGLGVDYTTSFMVDQPFVFPEYQNEYGGGYNQDFDVFSYNPAIHDPSWAAFDGQQMVDYSADESWGPRMEGQMVRHWDSWYPGEPGFGELRPFSPNPDNIENFFQNGTKWSNSIALYGGDEKATFRVAYTNLDQKGTMPNSGITRHNVNVTGNLNLSDRLHLGAKANYVLTDTYGRASVGDYSGDGRMGVMSSFNTWFERQLDMDRLKNYKNADGSFKSWNISSPENRNPFWWSSPYFEVYENTNNDTRERVYGGLSVSYDILDNLKITGWARTDFYLDRRERRVAVGHINTSSYFQEMIQNREDNYQMLMEYSTDLTSNISLSANLGGNLRYNLMHRESFQTVGGLTVPNLYNFNASVDRPEVTDIMNERKVAAVFGSTSLSFFGIWYLDGSLRNDWSSTLPVGSNSYLYPAVSSSFVFTELFPYSNVLSFGKIRYGWAQVGNDTDPYRLATYYEPKSGYGSTPVFSVPNILNNSDLKPEITTSNEIGLNLRFFDGRVEFDGTMYSMNSINQIIDLAVSSTSGYSSAFINSGEISNKGVEFMLSAMPIKQSDGLTWQVSFNWAKNQNKVVELGDGLDNYQLVAPNDGNGVSLNARVGQPYGALVGDAVAVNENGEYLVDDNGYYILEQNAILGNVMADYTGGFRNTFSYKGISLSALIDFQKGGDIYSVTSVTGQYSGLLATTIGNNDKGVPMRDPVSEGGGVRAEGVTESGEPNQVYVEAVDYFKNLDDYRDQHVFDASYVKFRELTISYSLPKTMLINSPFQNVSIGLVGRHLAIFHKNFPHGDPETAMGSGNVQGYESAQLPSPRSFGVNLKLNF